MSSCLQPGALMNGVCYIRMSCDTEVGEHSNDGTIVPGMLTWLAVGVTLQYFRLGRSIVDVRAILETTVGDNFF
jgi:hypothetical protein